MDLRDFELDVRVLLGVGYMWRLGFNFSLNYMLIFRTKNTTPNKFLKNINRKTQEKVAVIFVIIGNADQNFCLHK